jgi:hypothetical protein
MVPRAAARFHDMANTRLVGVGSSGVGSSGVRLSVRLWAR